MIKSFQQYVKDKYEQECFFTNDDPSDESLMWNWWWCNIEGFTEKEFLAGKRF